MGKKLILKLEALKTGYFEIELELLGENRLAADVVSQDGAIKVIGMGSPTTLAELFEREGYDNVEPIRVDGEDCDCEFCGLEETEGKTLGEIFEEVRYEAFKKHMSRWLAEETDTSPPS